MVLGGKGVRRQPGFTLLELLITLAIVVVLGMIAITSYSRYTQRAHRVEAKEALLKIGQQQERHYTTHHRYLVGDTALQRFNGGRDVTSGGRYTLEVSGSDSAYTVTAQAMGAEALRDRQCRRFTLDHTGRQTATAADGKTTTAECWGR